MHEIEYCGVNKYICIDLISSGSKVNHFYQFLILSRNSPVQSQWASCLKSGNDLYNTGWRHMVNCQLRTETSSPLKQQKLVKSFQFWI